VGAAPIIGDESGRSGHLSSVWQIDIEMVFVIYDAWIGSVRRPRWFAGFSEVEMNGRGRAESQRRSEVVSRTVIGVQY
jgi:hypothetical protein